MKKAVKKNLVTVICAGAISAALFFTGCTAREGSEGDRQQDNTAGNGGSGLQDNTAGNSGSGLRDNTAGNGGSGLQDNTAGNSGSGLQDNIAGNSGSGLQDNTAGNSGSGLRGNTAGNGGSGLQDNTAGNGGSGLRDNSQENAESRPRESSAGNTGNEPEEKALDAEELNRFTEFINQRENNGFLMSEYVQPQDVNLGEVLYNGAGFESESMSEAEQKAYEEAGYTVETDITRLTTGQIDDFLQRKMGIGIKDVTAGLDWVYLDEFDCYVFQHGDTNFCNFTCVSGCRIGDDIYELHCSAESDYVKDCVLTLKRTGEEYQILSNLFE